MSSQSQFIKNGQQLSVAAGAGAIAVNDLVLIGGPGDEAWTVGTNDYAVFAGAATITAQSSVVAATMPGSSRQPMARDRVGNIYLAGTNSSGRLVIYKFTPLAVATASAVLDATATSVNTAQLFQLSNGNYACVYARAAGALYFVVFDAALNLVSGPISVGNERAATNVVYHDSCSLSAGGFAIAYQTTAGTAINLATFSNAGATVTAATNIQTLAGSAAQETIKLAQLSNGNLACSYRGTMTAGGIAGTSTTVVSTTATPVAGPVSLDTAAVAGFIYQSVLAGFFAVAVPNGTNLICAVLSNAGAIQGSVFSTGNTLNSAVYPQTKLLNDGTQFWLAYFSSVANGLYIVQIPTAGGSGNSISALGGSTLSASTFALDADVVNGLIVALAASSSTSGQYWLSVGLPDASLGIGGPYLRNAPVAFGTVAGTTGSNWPRVIGGGAGLFPAAVLGQSTVAATNGDFTVVLAYDQQNTAATFIGVQKVEPSAIVGISSTPVGIGSPGTQFAVNPGPGEYPTNALNGSPGVSFNHLGASPSGTAGTLYGKGVALSGIAQNVSLNQIYAGYTTLPGNGAMKASIILFDTKPGTRTVTIPPGVHVIRGFTVGCGGDQGTGGGGYSEDIFGVVPGQVISYTVAAALGTSSFLTISATSGTGATSPGVGSGGRVNTSGGNYNGASGHRYGNGGDGSASASRGGGGWSQSVTNANGGNAGVDGFGLGMIPGQGGGGAPADTVAQTSSNGGYGAGGGGSVDASFVACGNGGIGGGGGNATSGSGGAGVGGIGGGGGIDGTGVGEAGGPGCVGIEVLA